MRNIWRISAERGNFRFTYFPHGCH